ncbi:hypothetical protein VTO42DRAFT_6413 [Malbranchea cinnamomea]
MATDIYTSLKFVFKIDFIGPVISEFDNRNGNSDWIPPSVPEAVDTWATTPWMRWTSTRMSKTADIEGPEVSVCSLFYNSETFSFLGVPYDCRQQSVKEERDTLGLGWRRLMFRYTDDDPPLSVIGFDSEYHVLAARGASNWMPQLVPPTYNQNQERYNGVISSRTGLAGELSVILGMAALSCPPTRNPDNMAQLILTVIGTSFRPPQWRPHNLKTGRIHASGVVVSVRVDPTPPVMGADILEKFQAGEFGPILEG